MNNLSISNYQLIYRTEKVTAVIDRLFDKIEQVNRRYNMFLSLDREGALKRARKLDLKREKRGRLYGSPVAIKDNIAVKGANLTCGSAILRQYKSPYTATAVEKLEAEDAVIVGKTNLDEFGMGSSTEFSAFKPTLNPLDPGRVPGGSSGGSAAAVASGLTPVSLGSDTGGSTRQPAAFTGTWGLRPTYGRVSRYGLVSFGPSFDVIGLIGGNLDDVITAFRVISGRDKKDSTSRSAYKPRSLAKPLRIGKLPSQLITSCQQTVSSGYVRVMEWLAAAGWRLETIKSELWDLALNSYHIMAAAEASSNLSRFDGIRYGSRIGAGDFAECVSESRSSGFGDEVKRRILLGNQILSSGYVNRYYRKAMAVRKQMSESFEKAFVSVDAIVTPTTPEVAFELGSKQNPIDIYLTDYFTVPVSMAGLPALSMPFILAAETLPMGLQIIVPAGQETNLFEIAKEIEYIIKIKKGGKQ